MDWAALHRTVRTGEHVCPDHGLVRPYRGGVVAACPQCMRATFVATVGGDGVRWRSEQPAHCAGPGRHRLAPGEVQVGWTPCRCTAEGGHRTWRCRAPGCDDVQEWPPHYLVPIRS